MPLGGRSRTGIMTMPVGGGIVADEVSHELAENICTAGLNVRFRSGYVRKTEGYNDALTAPSAVPLHIAPLQTSTQNYWVHVTATGIFADNGASKTDITGTALTGSASGRVTSCVLGGVLVFNNGVDQPQAWGGTGTATTLTGWDSSWRCESLRSFKNYLIALNVTKGATRYASMVKWSHAAEPGTLPDSWDEADPTRDAGELDVAETDDDITDGLSLGDTFIVYKERSAYGMQYLANNAIFRVFKLPGNYGVLAKNCVANTPVGHVVLTNGPDVVRHYANEPTSILSGRWRQWLQDNINPSAFQNAFVVANIPKYEVWICIPTTGNTYCNRALVWNYEEDTLTLIAIPNLTHAAVGFFQSGNVVIDDADYLINSASANVPISTFDVDPRLLATAGDSKIYIMDEGDDHDGTAINATFSRVGLSFGDPDTVKLLKGAVLRVDATAGTVLTVEGAYANDVEGPYSYTTPVTYTVGTSRRADFLCSGRFVGIRVTSAAGNAWRIKSVGYDVTTMGAY